MQVKQEQQAIWKPCERNDHVWKDAGRVGVWRCDVCQVLGFSRSYRNSGGIEAQDMIKPYKCPACGGATLEQNEKCPSCEIRGTKTPQEQWRASKALSMTKPQRELLEQIESGEEFQLRDEQLVTAKSLQRRGMIRLEKIITWDMEMTENGLKALAFNNPDKYGIMKEPEE